MLVDDDECSERLSTRITTKNVAKVWVAILEDRWRTIHDVSDIVKLSYEINMWLKEAKSVPRLLSNGRREHRVPVCSEFKEQTENDPNFISTNVTGDESWVYGYDLET
jgi:hypothetical protein